MMHIYGLHVGESLRIGDGVTAIVAAIRGGTVRIGIRASHDVPIYREEVAEDWENEVRPGRHEPHARATPDKGGNEA